MPRWTEARGCVLSRGNTDMFNHVWTSSLRAVCHTVMPKIHRRESCLAVSPLWSSQLLEGEGQRSNTGEFENRFRSLLNTYTAHTRHPDVTRVSCFEMNNMKYQHLFHCLKHLRSGTLSEKSFTFLIFVGQKQSDGVFFCFSPAAHICSPQCGRTSGVAFTVWQRNYVFPKIYFNRHRKERREVDFVNEKHCYQIQVQASLERHRTPETIILDKY